MVLPTNRYDLRNSHKLLVVAFCSCCRCCGYCCFRRRCCYFVVAVVVVVVDSNCGCYPLIAITFATPTSSKLVYLSCMPFILTPSLPSIKSTFLQPLKDKCKGEVVRVAAVVVVVVAVAAILLLLLLSSLIPLGLTLLILLSLLSSVVVVAVVVVVVVIVVEGSLHRTALVTHRLSVF